MTQERSPLLSIIIPTKNRYKTLIPVLDCTLKYIPSNNYEIIIQDNSDDNIIIQDYLHKKRDARLKYFYHAESLSVSENSSKAIHHSSGKYAILIGDDDLVSPYIIDITEYADKQDIECLIYPPGYYWWSSIDFTEESYYRRKNAFWLPCNISNHLQQKDAVKELEYALKNGGVSLYSLPRLYHGLAKKEILDKIQNKIGTYIYGSSPDMAIATSLALVIDHYFYIHYPISVFGASKNSAGGWVQEKKHAGKLEDQAHLPKDILKKWDNNIPRLWTVDTIYAQAFHETFSAFKVNKQINYNALYASMIVNESFTTKYVLPLIFEKNKLNIARYFHFFYHIVRKSFGKIYRKLKEKSKRMPYDVFIFNDINECMQLLSEKSFIKL